MRVRIIYIWPYTVPCCTLPGSTVPYRHSYQFVPYRIVRKDCVLDAPISYRKQYQYDASMMVIAKRQSTIQYRTLPYRVLGGGTRRACSLGIFAGTISVSAAQNVPRYGKQNLLYPRRRRDRSQHMAIFLSWPTFGRMHIHLPRLFGPNSASFTCPCVQMFKLL